MIHKITIPGELPTLNEIISASKQHWGQYSSMKKDWTDDIALLAKTTLPKLEPPINLRFTWYRRNRRVDPDNIAAAGAKLIIDGLVESDRIPNDGWKEIASISHEFEVDRSDPRVEVELWLEN